MVTAIAEKLEQFSPEGVPGRSWLRLRLRRVSDTEARAVARQPVTPQFETAAPPDRELFDAARKAEAVGDQMGPATAPLDQVAGHARRSGVALASLSRTRSTIRRALKDGNQQWAPQPRAAHELMLPGAIVVRIEIGEPPAPRGPQVPGPVRQARRIGRRDRLANPPARLAQSRQVNRWRSWRAGPLEGEIAAIEYDGDGAGGTILAFAARRLALQAAADPHALTPGAPAAEPPANGSLWEKRISHRSFVIQRRSDSTSPADLQPRRALSILRRRHPEADGRGEATKRPVARPNPSSPGWP